MKHRRQIKGLLPTYGWLSANGYEQLYRVLRRHPAAFAHIPQAQHDHKSLVDWVREAEVLARDHNGRLPHPWWLQKHGHGSLKNVVHDNPEAFAHLNQVIHRARTLEDYRAEALRLAAANDGKMPTWTWRDTHGHRTLNTFIGRHADQFADIPTETVDKLEPNGWRQLALDLAKANGGHLPCQQRLCEAGHYGLSIALRKYPKVFIGIKQESKRGRSLKAWRAIAETLARKNNGLIPTGRWLCQNRYDTLRQRIQQHRNTIFAGMKQETTQPCKYKTRSEWVAVAKALAQANKGTLPSPADLAKAGHLGLVRLLQKHPDLFHGIKQHKRQRRQPQEWISTAEKVAKQHGGVLPSAYWLNTHGLSGLSFALRAHPALFKHVSQT